MSYGSRRHDVQISDVKAGRDVIGVHEEHHHPQPEVSWPTRSGLLPPKAHCYQQRDLSDVLATVLSSDPGKGTPALILAGLGGVGKTQLAAEYARQCWGRNEVDLLVWISAESSDAIISAYADAAEKIGENPRGEQDANRVSGRFLEWLACTDRRWLIVLDDVKKPGDLKGLWPPQTHNGRVVVTTRRQDAALSGQGRHRIQVGTFADEEAVNYLRAKLAEHPALLDDAAGLAADVGYLPLALAQAAAYLADRNRSCIEYRQLLASRRKKLAELLPESAELPDDHGRTVAATWSLSVELADQLAPTGLARPILELASVLAPSGIPLKIFTNPAVTGYLTDARQEDGEVGADEARDALHCLQRLSLATVNSSDPHSSVRVHALVQRATRDDLDESKMASIVHAAADSLAYVWPDRSTNTVQERALQSCTAALITHGVTYLWNDDGVHTVLFRIGNSFGETGNVTGAVHHFQRLHDGTMRVFGPSHTNTMSSRSNLAHWRGRSGDAAGAVADLEELLPYAEQVLGLKNLQTLNVRHNLAHWRGEAGDAVGAVVALEELLPSVERVLGVDHPYALITQHTMAVFRGRAGDATGTAEALRKILPRIERVLGAEHPETLNARHNLAYWRGKAGDEVGAVTALRGLLSAREQVLGPDHPETLNTWNNVATLTGESGDTTGAITALDELLPHAEQALGPDHPLTLSVRHNLATWLGRAGDTTAATAALRELLPRLERVLGLAHPHTLISRRNLDYWTNNGESS